MSSTRQWLIPEGLPVWRYVLRVGIVVAELLLAYCLAGQNSPFFYQAF